MICFPNKNIYCQSVFLPLEKGKDLLQRILIAGAKQGNPIDEWKTNIAKLLRSKRNINPAGSSVITKAKTIYKGNILWNSLNNAT